MNMYDNFFDWEFKTIAIMLLPPVLRKPKTIALMQTLAEFIDVVYASLKEFRNDSEYATNFSSERIQFEHYLNDEFDRIGRTIKIVNSPFLNRIYVYKDIEGREDVRLYKHSENIPVTLYKEQEYEISIHFIIQIPIALALSDLQIKALRSWVDARKLPDKNYSIQNV